MNQDRITPGQLSHLIDGRDTRAAHAIENAARGVNATEHAIREITAMIRATLTEIEQRLGRGLGLNEYGELQRMPADLDRAIALRQHHWQVLGALLTGTELTSLQPAAPPAPCPPVPGQENSLMDQALIVIRDIHRYGEDLTVPQAIARLRGGGPVTVTVTGPAPPGGDPRGNPRHGFDITISPAGGTTQPRQPPGIAWDGTTAQDPAGAALFAGALTLASQLAGCTGPAGGQTAPAPAAR